jgi:hypothetical protein
MIRLLLILFLSYLAFRFIIAPLLRMFLQQAIKKAVEKEMDKVHPKEKNVRKEGSITVDYIPGSKGSKSRPHSGQGEYVDFEEIK